MSIKNKGLIILVLIGVLLVPFATAFAKGEPIYISPFGGEYTVSSKDEIVVRYGWAACSKGLVNDFIDSSTHSVFLNSILTTQTSQKNISNWSLPTSNISGEGCLWDVTNGWSASWQYSLGKLDPGTYELVVHRTLDFAVIDGYDINGDGTVYSFYNPFTFPTTIIHVNK